MNSLLLNCDIGESFGAWTMGLDAEVMHYIDCANIACGFHASDPSVMRKTVALAVTHDVRIGAHTAYQDLVGFGRRSMDCTPQEVEDLMLYQIGALEAFARVAGTRVRYVKPHGALYNAIVHHEAQATAVVDAVLRYDATLPVLGLPGSVFLALAADAGLTTVAEAFADRAYTPDGTLVSRREEGAVLHDAEEVAARCVRMATHGEVEAIDGSPVAVRPASLCVHGDSPGAVAMAARVRASVEQAGVRVAAFVDGPA